MNYKDIVNRDLVTLANCAEEPIHIPGSIQPHGCLLAVSVSDLRIDYCSGNTKDFIGLDYKQLLGKTLDEVFGKKSANSIRNYVVTMGDTSAPWELELEGKIWQGIIHQSGEQYIIELEPFTSEPSELSDVYQQTKRMIVYIKQATTLKMLCQSVADETRAITGYDRVMIYRFDEEYNGEVFAESVTEEQEKFLGLHYPHTDIPVQARELYIKNLLRIIVDVNYEPSPIFTMDNTPGKSLDLSLSTLRSVSPIHIQYLKNMGVAATLTISLIHEGKLWGLIACHHYSPKYITRYTRITSLLQGHFLTSQISAQESGEDYAVAQKTSFALNQLLEQLFTHEHVPFSELVKNPDLLSIANASSVIMVVDDIVYSQGDVPPEDEVRKLAYWLHTYSTSSIFSVDKLSVIYPEAKKWCALISGVLFNSLGSGRNNCIIWCRPESLLEVHWAGDREKAIVINENGLSPRKSFALWKEIKQCESKKWLSAEITSAAHFSNALQKQVHLMFMTKEELKQRMLNEKLKEANAELENLTWISTHDLKEPLRKIRVFASRIMQHDFTGNYALVLDLVKKMSVSAERMQLLLADVLSYSKFSNVEEALQTVSLKTVVIEVLKGLEEEIESRKAIIEFSKLPEVRGISFLLHQLFVNLLVNSLKFAKPDIPPRISITASVEKEFHVITIRDNGIGFDPKFKDQIFKVFSKLHSHLEYGGSGVGLALCKKIMKTHNGHITTESVPDQGAAFMLHFPK